MLPGEGMDIFLFFFYSFIFHSFFFFPPSVLFVSQATSISMSRSTKFENISSARSGGACAFAGVEMINMTPTRFINITATEMGGAIEFMQGSTFVLTDCEFTRCRAFEGKGKESIFFFFSFFFSSS
jgi:hypothetical protein